MFVGLFLLAIGIWGIVSPYTMWLIGDSWRSSVDAEGPSTFYKYSSRVISVILIVIGMIGIIDAFN
ncbi:hypothetical protein H0266_13890 [Halobacillus locisalis]|uniref:DUF6199 domain-containing protein n=1 Tax=Halobacillus locisalis TaxID=220753 RepID=A0A838CVP0_9BACI|nr:DUF6199 family natural product biosynthesis protein [Halobacillus locisalis]MBA2175983.1 hypothetical protein [Halobacillus locisalis]